MSFSSFQLLSLGAIHHSIFNHLFELVKFCQYGRALCFRCLFDLFVGVLCKSCCQSICITAFEKNQVLWWRTAAVLFHRIVHAVFPGDLLKLLDGGIGDLDIGNALVLTNELLDRLLTLGFTGASRLLCLFSFFSLRWARYLQMAALNSRSVNFVPLTTSVKVLFSTSSCMG